MFLGATKRRALTLPAVHRALVRWLVTPSLLDAPRRAHPKKSEEQVLENSTKTRSGKALFAALGAGAAHGRPSRPRAAARIHDLERANALTADLLRIEPPLKKAGGAAGASGDVIYNRRRWLTRMPREPV